MEVGTRCGGRGIIYDLHHHASKALFKLIKSPEFERFEFKKHIIRVVLSSIPLSKFCFLFYRFF